MVNLNARIHEIPVGVDGTMEPVEHTVRTEAQLERVTEIVRSAVFAYAVNNPFTRGVTRGYRGPFTFTWYDGDGKMHGDRIMGNGKISQSVEA